MRALSAIELLNVWDTGWDKSPAERALALLVAACPDETSNALAHLSVGERDSRLLTLREYTFGPQLNALTACPNCGERLELALQVSDLRPDTPGAEGGRTANEPLRVKIESYVVSFRLPDSTDLLAASKASDTDQARQVLLDRCLVSIEHDGGAVSVDQLPPNVLQDIVERMAQADPQADVQLSLSCPTCYHQWQETFDIVAFFWAEIDAWARRMLREVHMLAQAYGWRELDILALSPRRRQYYLDLVSGV